MHPFAQVLDAEMFVTYADDEKSARAEFTEAGLPADGRIRKQPSRKASEFKYTRKGETLAATIVGDVPAEFRDYDPVDVSLDIDAQPEAPLVDESAE